MLKENVDIVIENFYQFNGEGRGLYIVLFVLSMIYIFIKEKNKNIKIFFVVYNLIVFFITLNPIFNKIVGNIFTSTVYLRVFWLLSIGITISYCAVNIINEHKDMMEKIVITFAIILLIAVSGKMVYNSENYTKTDNNYKISDEAVEVAQILGKDDEENKKALVSESLSAYIRQVDGNIKLAYKRNPESYYQNEFVIAMLQGNSEEIANLAIESNCNYIVLKKDIPLTLDMGYFGFSVLDMTENYTIYKLVETSGN